MSQKRKTGQVRVFDASFMLSILLTAAFYVVMYLPSMCALILQHYTTEHVVEYVIVWLFAWGIIDIMLKLMAFPREIFASGRNGFPRDRGASR